MGGILMDNDKVKRSFYLSREAYKAIEKMYASCIVDGDKKTMSEIASEAIIIAYDKLDFDK
jgi:hypothetical protein